MAGFRGLDRWLQRTAAGTARNAEARGVARNEDWIKARPEGAVADQLISQGVIPESQRAQVMGRMVDDAGREAVAQEYGRRMNRGPAGMGRYGVREGLNRAIATNAVVRREVLPTAVVGGSVMAGAALTEGAQQLMALMGFIEQGRQQEARAEQSPLIQPGSVG